MGVFPGMMKKTKFLLCSVCGLLCAFGSADLVAAETLLPAFADVTASAGITGGEGSWGGAWGDYDGDGDIDLMSLGHLQPALGGENVLWRNNGDGTFTDVTETAGLLSDKVDTHSVTWADLDKDGDLDLLLVSEPITDRPHLMNELWRNNGDGTFTDVADAAGINPTSFITRGSNVIDYDRDGWLDLFMVVQAVRKPEENGNLLFRHREGLLYDEVSAEAGVQHPEEGRKRMASWGDANNDGLPDMVLTPPGALYLNQGDGTFSDESAAAGLLPSEQTQHASWVDFDDDGWMDLYLSRGYTADTADILYRNRGDGTFTDVTLQSGLDAILSSRGVSWGDYDNDGDKDLYVVSFKNFTTTNRLYRNNGDGTFSDVAVEENATGAQAGAGAHSSFADYDSDGDLDLFLTNGDGNGMGPYVLLNNRGNDNHWFKVALQGESSNRDGLMARLKVNTRSKSQYFSHSGPANWMSQSNLPVHVGLGSDERVNRLIVTWPNGTVQLVENLAADQMIRLREGVSLWEGTPSNFGPGFTIWKNGVRWKIKWQGTADGNSFSGRISAAVKMQDVRGGWLEAGDSLSWDNKAITFEASEGGVGADLIDFVAIGAVTFDLQQDGVAQPTSVYLGPQGVRPATLPVILRRD